MLTPPVFLLLLGVEAVAGALAAATGLPVALVCFPSAIGFIACADRSSLLWQSQSAPAGEGEEKRKRIALLLMFVAAVAPALAFIYTELRLPHVSENDLAKLAGRVVFLEATVDNALPEKTGKYARFVCSAHNARQRNRKRSFLQKCQGSTLLFIPSHAPVVDELAQGAHLSCLCRVASIDELDKQGKHGYATYLKRLGVTSLCYLCGEKAFVDREEDARAPAEAISASVGRTVESARLRLIAAHTDNLGKKIGSLLSAMVLGEKAVGLDAELLSSFRNVGLSHILAASGFNLTVVTFSTRWACRLLCISALPSNCLSFLMMIVFVLFAGNSSSVVRAALMCALAIACRTLSRRVDITGLLGAALVMSILIDPLSVADPGYQLSYVAVSGIIFVVAPLASRLEAIVERHWLRWTLVCIATVMVAQACVLPLQVFYFRQIGLLFLPANLLASLVVTPITVAGFASSLMVLLCPQDTVLSGPLQPLLFLAAGLDWLAAIPLNVLVFAVSYLSSVPFAVLTVPPISGWQVLLYYLILILLFYLLLGKLPVMHAVKRYPEPLSPASLDA